MTTTCKPFRPYITLEQILAYDPRRDETRTPSPEVNAILDAMHTIGPGAGTRLNRYLRLDTETMSTLLRVATGMTLSEVRRAVTRHMAERLMKENPKMHMSEVSEKLGYGHRSSAWWIENGEHQNRKRRAHYREWLEDYERRMRAKKTGGGT